MRIARSDVEVKETVGRKREEEEGARTDSARGEVFPRSMNGSITRDKSIDLH